jgi:hypothetical protein
MPLDQAYRTRSGKTVWSQPAEGGDLERPYDLYLTRDILHEH